MYYDLKSLFTFSLCSFHIFLLGTNFIMVSLTFLVLKSHSNGLHSSLGKTFTYLLQTSFGFSLPNNNQPEFLSDLVTYPLLEGCIFYCHVHSCLRLMNTFPFLPSNGIIIISMLVLVVFGLFPVYNQKVSWYN